MFYALIRRFMAPVNQYVNMLTGFLDKKFILSQLVWTYSAALFMSMLACLALGKLFHCQKLQAGQGTLPIFLIISPALSFIFKQLCSFNYGCKLGLGNSYWEQVMHVHHKEGQTYSGGTREKALSQQTHNQPPHELHWVVMALKLSGTCISHT